MNSFAKAGSRLVLPFFVALPGAACVGSPADSEAAGDAVSPRASEDVGEASEADGTSSSSGSPQRNPCLPLLQSAGYWPGYGGYAPYGYGYGGGYGGVGSLGGLGGYGGYGPYGYGYGSMGGFGLGYGTPGGYGGYGGYGYGYGYGQPGLGSSYYGNSAYYYGNAPQIPPGCTLADVADAIRAAGGPSTGGGGGGGSHP